MIFDTKNDRSRLVGIFGLLFFYLIMFLGSKSPFYINWSLVFWGSIMQFVSAFLVLRWQWSSDRFNDASHYIVTFLEFTYNGTNFVYGFLSSPPNICGMNPIFAFSALQILIFFAAIVNLLFYYGIIQIILKWMAFFMQSTLGTTATESLNACACTFLGLSEAPLLIKPYLNKMTPSEIHAVMTAGFACVAGKLTAKQDNGKKRKRIFKYDTSSVSDCPTKAFLVILL